MSRSTMARHAALGVLLVLSATTPAAAQHAAPTDTSRHAQTLFTAHDAALAAGFAGLTVALFPADRYVARHLRDRTAPPNATVDRLAGGFELVALPGAFVVGPALYVYGRLAHHDDLADLGWHGTEAVIVGTGVAGLLKGVLGRSRPYVTADTNPRDFRIGRGFASEDRSSFPSGHTTIAFAAASAVTSEVHRLWPQYTWLAGATMYGGATLTGVSRMYHDKHWASDIALGAAIGTFSGLKVVRYSHAHPGNMVDRVLLHTAIAPDGRGGGVLAFEIQP